jgi:hypothetical protein
MTIEKTLAERGARYGDFTDHAFISQQLQDTMRDSGGWWRLSDDKRQALTVIADKIARILTGDPEYKDNWHDIQGYAKLAEDRCKEREPARHDDTIVTGEWVKWDGGLMPVYPTARVEAELRCGDVLEADGENLKWHHSGKGHDIIAYRIVPEQFSN